MEGFGNMFVSEPEIMQDVVRSGEFQEGIKAFLENRKPRFNK